MDREKAKELLGQLAPQDKKQEKIFNEAVSKLIAEIALKRQQIAHGQYEDANGLLMVNRKLQKTHDGFSKGRELRKIADIPFEVVEKIKMKYGSEIMDPKNTKELVKVLRTDSEFEGCLTVKRGTI